MWRRPRWSAATLRWRRLPRSLQRGPDRRGRTGRARQALHRDGERGPTGAREPSDRARRPCARWPARAPERRPDRGRGLPGDGGFGVPGRANRPRQRGADQFGRPREHPGPRRHDDPDLLDRGGGPRRAIPPPDDHEELWAIQRTLDFPRTVFGMERHEATMERVSARYAERFGRHRDDRVLD
jgi:hypothetical protein